MRYIDERALKENEAVAEVGDFIFADGDLMVITKTYTPDIKYRAVLVVGEYAFNGAGVTEDSIEEVVSCLKEYGDFELIKSDEMKLVREP